MARWCAIWNRSGCAASMRATSRPARTPWRSTRYGDADAIITNPPYTRELMHRLIAHFQRIAPTWLLIDYDWSATKQAAPFMPHCSDIVILPRLKWFEDSKDTGKDNHAWYSFDVRHSAGPIFHCARLSARCSFSRQIVRAMRQAVSAAAIQFAGSVRTPAGNVLIARRLAYV